MQPQLQQQQIQQMSFEPLDSNYSQQQQQQDTVFHNLVSSPPSLCCSSSSCSTSSNSSCSSSKNSPTIGVNLRVTGQCSQGGRKYMEDYFSVAYQQSDTAKDLEYAFIGIYDGHGGAEAATFAKEHLMMEIINQKLFWSDSDQDVLRAIREGYIATHYAMWRDQDKWPKTANGLPSTAGTTATVAFIRREKIYIGHVGDSGIVLGYQNENENFWRSKQLTTDHKPESLEERTRIMRSGGKVVVKSGVPRVVWNRPRNGHKGPIRRNTPVDEIPFLAVARSLGDLWSYNSERNEFVVSPDPDVKVIKINPQTFRCLIFGTDGLWNVVTAQEAVDTVFEKESINERLHALHGDSQEAMGHTTHQWTNPSKGLVDRALKTWSSKKMRADNTSVVTVILYPPGGHVKESNAASCIGQGAAGDLRFHQNCENLNYSTFDEVTNEYESISYQQVAEKYLPPEAYRNFNYYDEEMVEEEEHSMAALKPLGRTTAEVPETEMDPLMQKYNRLGFNYWLNNKERYISETEEDVASRSSSYYVAHRQGRKERKRLRKIKSMLMAKRSAAANEELQETDEEEMDVESPEEAALNQHEYVSQYSSENSNCASSSYMSHHNSFAESYNSLLSEQIHPHSTPSNSNSNSASCQSISGSSMHEILQEQQLYQQQCMSEEEGYSLTKLETRREQQRCSTAVQTFKIFQQFQANHEEAAVEDEEATTSSSSSQPNYWEAARYPAVTGAISKYLSYHQPTENESVSSFELNSLLQQERQEEEQVALERAQLDNSFEMPTKATSCLDDTITDEDLEEDEDEDEDPLVEEYLESVEILQDHMVQIHEISSSCGTEHTEDSSKDVEMTAEYVSEETKTSDTGVVEKIDKIEIVLNKSEMSMEAPSTSASKCTTKSLKSIYTCATASSRLPLVRSQSFFANVNNENQRKGLSKLSSSNYRIISNSSSASSLEKRQLRSADYGKRTLRTRNSLTKDLKAKSSLKRSSAAANHFLRKTASSLLAVNSDSQAARELLNGAATSSSCHSSLKRISRAEKHCENVNTTSSLPHRSHAIHLRSRLVAAVVQEATSNSCTSANVSPSNSRQLRSKASLHTIDSSTNTGGSFSKSTRYQSSSASSLAAPPPSPKLINGAAAVAAATRARSLLNAKHAGVVQAVFSNKRSSLRSGASDNASGIMSVATSTRSRVAKKLKR